MRLCAPSSKSLNIFISAYIALIAILLFTTPLTQSEANILYLQNYNLSSAIAKFFYSLSYKHWFIRVPFFILSIINIKLIKEIAYIYIKDEKYANLAILIYLITPGVFVSSILINYATVAIFLTLIFIYGYHKSNKLLQIFSLVLLLFTGIANFVFYIAIALYSYKKRDWTIFYISLILLIIAIATQTYPINGVPKGHLSQVLGIYAVTLSPFYFFAVVYAIYRIALDKKESLLWYIVTTFFVVSILLSFRQKIRVTDFTPFVVIASILVVSVYKNSISIRLKIFQKNYKRVCFIIVSVLLLETSLVAFSYPLYMLFGDKFKLIDTSIYKISQKTNIKCKKEIKKRDINLYRYYGIKKCN